ncbi:MAG: undecaprenyl-phosphate galactose phosphotransferase WbaP [Spirochaetaceae bacterium]|jgi:Undecaprenyl-phosphate galactose phosphotransferase WbaP|nr:undecaprenyl-phosphate galactose phosphotransferase WbaP [Spirochaetaceae bacterium]
MDIDEYVKLYRQNFKSTSSSLTNTVMIISDLFGVMLAIGVGFFFVNLYDPVSINFRSFLTYWPYLPVFIAVFQVSALYPGISMAPAEEMRRIFIGCLMSFGGIMLSRYIEDQALDAIQAAFLISFVFSTVILMFCRSVMRRILAKTGKNGIPAVIYSSGAIGRMIVDKLLDKRRLGYRPVLILDNDVSVGESYRDIPIIHNTGIGPEIVEKLKIKIAIVAIDHIKRKDLVQLLNDSVSAFRYNIMIPDFFGLTSIWMSARDFDGILGLAATARLKMPWNLTIKRLVDIVIVIAGGLAILPILLIIALLIKVSSKGPVLYRQKRIGKNGKYFYAYKFRTMVLDADKKLEELLQNDSAARQEWEANQKIKNDPRVTAFGKFLRRLSLDELPQLLNVLKNDMSLVGPRPIVDAEIPKYGYDFKRIFSVKPGITGLWQVSGRSDTDYSDRVSFDTYYLQSWSIWLDLWILYKTVGAVLLKRGAY